MFRWLRRRKTTAASSVAPEAAVAAWVAPSQAEQAKAEADALFESGRIADALAAYRRVVATYPPFARAWNNYGLCLGRSGELGPAEQAFREALAQAPRLVAAWVNLASVLEETKRIPEAAEALASALGIDPTSRDAANNLAVLLAAQGQFCAAEARCRAALEHHPDDVGLHFNLGLALVRQARIREALEALRRAHNLQPGYRQAGSAYLMALNYSDHVTPDFVRAEHERIVAHWQIPAPASLPIRDADAAGPLRVGYVSADFGFHVVSFFIEPVLAGHDCTRVEPYCYFTGEKEDAQCERIKALGVKWRAVGGMDDDAVLNAIRADRLDIAVDLSGHSGGHRLACFARRVAPVQCTWLGYPNTTGVPAIDYRLTDAAADPPGLTDAWHTERLIRLEHGFLLYRPRAEAGPVFPLPALAGGVITFGCFSNFAKVSDSVLALWALVLSAVPGARLLVKSKGLDERPLADATRLRFRNASGDVSRLVLEGEQPNFEHHMARYGAVDIALDTFPYAGTTTTCEALWMGVPVVTLAGAVHAARVGKSLLALVGHPEWVAELPEDYVRIAAGLAGDLQALSEIRRGLREEISNSRLTDARGFVASLECTYRELAGTEASRSGDSR